MKIYIIEAEQGEYADRQNWIVKVVSSKKKADELTDELDQAVKRITEKFNELVENSGRRYINDLPEWKEVFEDLPDPMLKDNWVGCEYFWYEMEVE